MNKIKPEIRIFIFCCAVSIVTGFMSTLTNTLLAFYAPDVQMTDGIKGIFLSMGGVMTAVVVSLPGRLVDKIGSKRTLMIIAIGLLVSLGMFSTSGSAIECMIWFSLYSLVTSASLPCSTQALKVYDVKNPAKLIRITLVGGMISGIFVSSTCAAMIEKAGLSWRQTYLVFTAIGAVVLLIGFAFIVGLKYDYKDVLSKVDKKEIESKNAAAKAYKFTADEKMACLALCLLYIGYMGIGIALGNWMPAYLQGRGFTGVQVSIPNTAGRFAQLVAYLLLPMISAKLLKSNKATPVAVISLIVAVVGILVPMNLSIITISRALMAVLIGFISMHIQSDCAIVSPAEGAGRFSSIVMASANAGGVVAVILMGYLPSVGSKLALFITFAIIGTLGAILLIKPYDRIKELKGIED